MKASTKNSRNMMTEKKGLIDISTFFDPTDGGHITNLLEKMRKALEFKTILDTVLQEAGDWAEKDLEREQWIELADAVLTRLYAKIQGEGVDFICHDDRDGARSLNEEAIRQLVREVIQEKLEKPPDSPGRQEETMTTGLPLSENAIKVLKKRYLKRGPDGEPSETPEDMFRRVAADIAETERLYGADDERVALVAEEFYGVMTRLEFLPNSPTLRGAGRVLQQLSACFVLPVGDCLEEIFDALKYSALIHKTGGGVGFSFSRLRPRGDEVTSTGNVAGGPVSFMKVFNSAAQEITQGGVRMGANIGLLSVDHPDIIEFITCKKEDNTMTNFNISVAVTDLFMEAVKNNQNYELINPRTGRIVKSVNANKIFNLMAAMAWQTGDPGIVFLDAVNRSNPTPNIGRIESTNPCGEQPLLPYESCNLGSINLAQMVFNGEVDWEKLRRTVRIAVQFLDNVIDRNKYVLDKFREMTLSNRKIGLGVMGFADMLIKLRIPYDSQEGLQMAEKIMSFISNEADQFSMEMALERGPFPNFPGSIYDVPEGKPIRNATRTTIAPTGTIGVIACCSSGVEPVFALVHTRETLYNKDGSTEKLLVVNPYLEKELKERGLYTPEVMESIALSGSLQGLEGIPADMKQIYVTAHDISPEAHVKMQAAFQRFIDNAVSKTVNLPHDAGVEDVRRIFMLAHDLGCKGITIFRDGCRCDQVLKVAQHPVIEQKEEYSRNLKPRPRPQRTVGTSEMYATGCGKLYITVNYDEVGLCEVFTSTGRSGGCPSQSEAVGRLVSLALRSGVAEEEIINQLKGIRCMSTMRLRKNGSENANALSCPSAIGKAIEHSLNDPRFKQIAESETSTQKANPKSETNPETELSFQNTCPDCGASIELEGGCVICRECGYSHCG